MFKVLSINKKKARALWIFVDNLNLTNEAQYKKNMMKFKIPIVFDTIVVQKQELISKEKLK